VGHKGGLARDHNAAVFQADKRDEETDAAGDGQLQLVWDGGDDLLPHAGDREGEEDAAVDEDEAECGLPGHAESEADSEGEIGVDAHAGGERQRVVSHEPHEQRADGGGDRGHGDQGGLRHAGIGENTRVDREDVGHRGERRRAGLEFAADGGAGLVEFVDSVQHGFRGE
jgi:hypothetical protein